MTTHQDEQRERRQTVLKDARLREQQHGATLSDFARAEAETDRGRYTAHEKSTVIGSTPTPAYPAGPTWSVDPVLKEEPLNYDINAMEPVGTPAEVERSIRQAEKSED